MTFLCWIAGLTLFDRMRNMTIRENLGKEPLHLQIETSQLRKFGHFTSMLPGQLPTVSGMFHWSEAQRIRPRSSKEIIFHIWLVNIWRSSRSSWYLWPGKGKSWQIFPACCHHSPHSEKCKENEWSQSIYSHVFRRWKRTWNTWRKFMWTQCSLSSDLFWTTSWSALYPVSTLPFHDLIVTRFYHIEP